MRFGRLLVICRTDDAFDKFGYRFPVWKCKCDCGKYKNVKSGNLRNGRTNSCGCLVKEAVHPRHKYKNGDYDERLYQIWIGIKRRCDDKRRKEYEHYGARGITYCEEWNDFHNFYLWAMSNGYSSDLTIDRIDVNGNYEPKNCKWSTIKEQNRNMTTNHYIEYNGETHCISEWADILGISVSALGQRINNGWDVERAFLTPVKSNLKHFGRVEGGDAL